MTPTNHDSSKVLLGTTGSSVRDVSCEPGDPSVCKAGLAVTRGSDGELDVGGAAGSFLGVSLGKNLSDTEKCAVLRTGLRVPVKLKDDNVFASLVKAELTFTAKTLRGTEGHDISITFVDDGAGAVEVSVDGLAITVEMDDTAETGSTAADIKAAIEANAEAHALISVEISEGDEDVVQDDFVEDFLENGVDAFAWVVIGDPVEIDGTTGEATEDDEATSAVYASGVLDAIDPLTGAQDGYAALVDMVGGL
jgi:hypothetical protein